MIILYYIIFSLFTAGKCSLYFTFPPIFKTSNLMLIAMQRFGEEDYEHRTTIIFCRSLSSKIN